MTAAEHRKAIRELLESFTPRHRMWETFDAWTEAPAPAPITLGPLSEQQALFEAVA